ncbi:hypothetical protein K3495_g6696 [Podosphaera aphanis]|nr:hypothetical protein K3495_g6696 [Podosphaera aphanis]
MDVLKVERPTALSRNSKSDTTTASLNALQPTYKSYKKKFRKLKHRFDEALQRNKDLYYDEQRAIQTAKRLAIENDRILDMLYDVNCSAQIPAEKRIDLTEETPCISMIPPLVSDDELSRLSKLKTPQGKALCDEINSLIATQKSPKSSVIPKSLAFLIATVPHHSSSNPHLPPEILASLDPDEGQSTPYSYLTPEQIDHYNYEIDALLGDISAVARPPSREIYQDPVFGNFHSPYNWLRRNVPQIFLQDGESSEKSNGKPGALRGAGKRANIPAPSKPDSLEIVEEDGQGYEFALSGQKDKEKKRKREDDCGSTPKRVVADESKAKKSKQPRKKKPDVTEEKPPSSRKSKRVKIPSPPPGAHPFGPA